MPRRRPVLRRRRKDRGVGGSESRSLAAHFVDSLMTGAPALPAEELEIPTPDQNLTDEAGPYPFPQSGLLGGRDSALAAPSGARVKMASILLLRSVTREA